MTAVGMVRVAADVVRVQDYGSGYGIRWPRAYRDRYEAGRGYNFGSPAAWMAGEGNVGADGWPWEPIGESAPRTIDVADSYRHRHAYVIRLRRRARAEPPIGLVIGRVRMEEGTSEKQHWEEGMGIWHRHGHLDLVEVAVASVEGRGRILLCLDADLTRLPVDWSASV